MSCQRTLSKARGITPLRSDQDCLLPLHQDKVPKRCASESCTSTTASLESCPPVPGTAARTPGQSRQRAHSGSGALGCGAPPDAAAQAEGNTSQQGNHHLSKRRGKSSTKSPESWCYTHRFNGRVPIDTCRMGQMQKEDEKHFSSCVRDTKIQAC